MAIKAKMLGRGAVMRKLNQLVPEAEKQLAEAQLEAAKELAGDIAARAPVETGEYKASIEGARLADRPASNAVVGGSATKDKNATGVFAAWYWRFVEFGTSPHKIKAKPGKMLHLHGNVFASEVDHPGARAQPHIFPTFRAARPRIRRKMANAVNKATRKVMGK
ncbi:hypothetical protein ASD64_08950 [Mesorhizobium sp. Root157]|uniref:HK97-gp10 family putative phage morphogenesis protein n=1 Tax=Mesorhizobium sp. Root157 TaxID=1736477 RepID=UPI0006F801A4|nr:HK97-gp10 family putative phage morphogenesis protein [Mesorhizobium sp. Root157]KQZ81876.1 hypothetical protein ASD64_08950 [Mesorhizobium sp. Root157]